MKPEDRARLEEIRGAATRNLEVSDDRLFELLRIIDEQAAEIARLEWPGPGEDDKPLPEDAAINAAFPTRSGSHEQHAEAMRLVGARRSKGGLVALVNWLLVRSKGEAEKLHAIADYSRRLADEAVARVTELQALVDAATRFQFGPVTVVPPDYGGLWVIWRPGKTITADTRDEAIAHARDLAAKEKEPTR